MIFDLGAVVSQANHINSLDAYRAGMLALTDYHNQMEGYYDSYNLDFEQLKTLVRSKDQNFIEKLGEALITAGFGARRTWESMERVVDKSIDGKVPSLYTFQTSIADEASSFDFSLLGDASLDLAKVVYKKAEKLNEAVGNVVTGATEGVSGIGDTLSKAGMFSKIAVGLVLVVGAFILYSWGKRPSL